MTTESAIDTHLVCPRHISRRVPDTYEPPFPMFVGRADHGIEQVTMGYRGVQSKGDEQRPAALAAIGHIVATLDSSDGPAHHDVTHHVDNQGYDNYIVVGYWNDPTTFTAWLRSPDIDSWWTSDERLGDGSGISAKSPHRGWTSSKPFTRSKTSSPASAP